MHAEAPFADTRILAILSCAEWCANCKVLEPKVTCARESNTIEGVEFATLDFTDRDMDAVRAKAQELGIFEAFRADSKGTRTGLLYLIDQQSNSIVAIINKSMNEVEIKFAIVDAAATS